jgi:hypothetical protein
MSSVNPYADVIDWLATEEGKQWSAENHMIIGHAYQVCFLDEEHTRFENAFRFAWVKVDGDKCAESGDKDHQYCTEGPMVWTAGATLANLNGRDFPLKPIEGELPSCP